MINYPLITSYNLFLELQKLQIGIDLDMIILTGNYSLEIIMDMICFCYFMQLSAI